jgi:signal recognition particle receptor subunit alpha
MLESLTIFHKGGLVLFQYLEQDSSATAGNSIGSPLETLDMLNVWLESVYLNPTMALKERYISMEFTNKPTKMVMEWEETSDLLAIAVYPDIASFPWIRNLVEATLDEYQVFRQSQQKLQQTQRLLKDQENNSSAANNAPPKQDHLFNKTFQVLFKQHKSMGGAGAGNTSSNSLNTPSKGGGINKQTPSKGGNKGKEKRHWHDGKAKVTKEAMAELDRSKKADGDEEDGTTVEDNDAVALAEARAAYLPSDADLADFAIQPTKAKLDDSASEESENSWGNSLKGLFQQVTGQKVLTKQDLELPLKEMHKMLTSKNVAGDIAQQICDKVEQQLLSKKLNSMYRVKTAVRQALESVISKLLEPSTKLDLLRQVVSQRDAWSNRGSNRRPFVIVVVGINGVGKSTSLAKLAYYLKTNGCKPLLAACDTFRSGAVEQLGVHAKCLELPLFHKGYAKDPSSVAKAAIEQAIQEDNDVVLVDTAGRMQNNVPLMKALGKLAHENSPDLILFVGEALVGNDGVDQVRMFHQAVSSANRNNKINAILLTKFDTVSDKVGAALSMTHVTNAPILFVGTGQKYHHLQKLSTETVIQSLFR